MTILVQNFQKKTQADFSNFAFSRSVGNFFWGNIEGAKHSKKLIGTFYTKIRKKKSKVIKKRTKSHEKSHENKNSLAHF